MPRVHFARCRFPASLRRLLTLLVGLGQLVVVSAAWLDRAPDATGARPHVENAGTRLHHGHSSSACELCSAQHAGGVPTAPRSLAVVARPRGALPRSPGPQVVQAERIAANRTRAPPHEA